ncbi:MAG TPA: alkene reductase [Dongiaceae bacterium]
MTKQPHPHLTAATKIGAVTLSHRIVMAPLTRMRATVPGDVPGPLMVEYYGQRASEGGLIISEATTISETARGYLGAPGLYTDAQVAGWRQVTAAVHAKGGRIFAQLWHVGRVSHVDLAGGAAPVAPSAVSFDGMAFTAQGWVPVSPPRALTVAEIPALIDDYRRAAERAKAAGFDGIEIHAGNGYLIDQFLQDGTNKRTDSYGGSVENRARLLFEVVDAVRGVWDATQIGIRLSPSSQFQEMSDSNPEATFGHVGARANQYGLAYLHVIEPRIKGNAAIEEGLPPVAASLLKRAFKGTIIAAGGFEPASADAILAEGAADLVAFGRHFIANPDLPKRIARDLPLNAYDRDTFYGGGHRGYTDYPFYEDAQA